MPPRRALALQAAALLAVASLAAVAPPASAHAAGSPPIDRAGSVVLLAQVPNSVEHELHVFVESGLNFPVQPGDTLAWNWTVNGGLGPDIEFTVHNHRNGTYNFVEYRGRAHNGSWPVSDNLSLMVSFVNPTAYNLTVNYSFTLHAPPATFSPAFFILPAAAGLAFGWFLWVRAGRAPEEGGLDEAYPTDPAAGRRRRKTVEEE
jgi:hypothetical protein